MNCWAYIEDAHRYERAKKLARLIIEWRISTQDARTMADINWDNLAKAAEIATPKAKTRELTIDLVELARTPVLAHSSKLGTL